MALPPAGSRSRVSGRWEPLLASRTPKPAVARAVPTRLGYRGIVCREAKVVELLGHRGLRVREDCSRYRIPRAGSLAHPVAGNDVMAAEEVGRRHRLLAGQLDLEQPDRVPA